MFFILSFSKGTLLQIHLRKREVSWCSVSVYAYVPTKTSSIPERQQPVGYLMVVTQETPCLCATKVCFQFRFFNNMLIDIIYIIYKSLFKMQHSVIFIVPALCTHHHNYFKHIFITIKKILICSHSPFPASPLVIGNANLLSISMDLPILDISYKWNHRLHEWSLQLRLK